VVQKFFPQGRLLRAGPLKGGISAEMIVLEIAGAGEEIGRWIVGRPMVPRRNSRSIEDEFRLLEIINLQGLVSPAPIAFDRSGEVFTEPYMVIAYIEGRPNFSHNQPESFAMQMADELGKIHAIDGRRADLSFLPRLEERPFIQKRPPQMDA
jgi:aminoglycoside phosphotransferase (APT) family kinase protein